nr:tetratricopeptide repeat protein [uncultured Methanoregula sp.]
MRLKWIAFLVIAALLVVFVILPTYAPTITVKSVMRDGKAAAGDALVLMNQSELAVTVYDNALAENASDSVLLKKKGEALTKCGRVQDAEKVYRQVLTQDARDTTAMVRMGDTLCRQGDLTGALSYYDAALAVKPNDAVTLLRKGDTLMAMTAQDQQKLKSIAQGFSKQPGSPGYQPVSAESLQSMDSYKKAVESYQKAMEIDPKLSVVVSARLLQATQNQVSSYQGLMGDAQSGG